MDDEIIEKDIKEAMKAPRLQKTMDKILSLDKERYFLTLAQQGVRFPSDFDLNQLRNTTNTQGSSQQEPLILDLLGQSITSEGPLIDPFQTNIPTQDFNQPSSSFQTPMQGSTSQVPPYFTPRSTQQVLFLVDLFGQNAMPSLTPNDHF